MPIDVKNTSEVAMGRRWSYDEVSENDSVHPMYAFTDHRDDEVKFITMDCTPETAAMLYEMLNHECDHDDCDEGIGEPERDESRD